MNNPEKDWFDKCIQYVYPTVIIVSDSRVKFSIPIRAMMSSKL